MQKTRSAPNESNAGGLLSPKANDEISRGYHIGWFDCSRGRRYLRSTSRSHRSPQQRKADWNLRFENSTTREFENSKSGVIVSSFGTVGIRGLEVEGRRIGKTEPGD